MKKILVLLTVCFSLVFVSCSVSNEAVNESYDAKEDIGNIAFDYEYNLAGEENSSSSDTGSSIISNSESEDYTEITETANDRKIIYSSSFTIETKNYDDGVTALKKLCDEFGAWIETSNSYGTADQKNRYSHYAIRVPVDNYNTFISRKDSIGVVVSSYENNRDVTEQYTDLEARLSSASLREERVLEILKNASSLDDVLSLEKELSEIRYEIESITGSLRKYDSLVSYATVTINISEVSVTSPTPKSALTFKERMSRGFSEGIDSFVSALQSFLVFISYNFIPLIIWILVIGTAVVVIVKVRNRKKEKSISYTEDKHTESEVGNDDKK